MEININEVSQQKIPLSEQGILGYLELSGNETLFALDGQHRISGIKEALKKAKSSSNLLNEEVSVIFIGHKTDQDGKERTRRLFTTLNRNAKRVSLSETIALDEDDICAILTRRLVETHRLFDSKKISLTKGSSLAKNDYSSFTNIVSLYRCLNEVLPVFLINIKLLSSKQKWRDFKKLRPKDDVIDISQNFIVNVLEKLIEQCVELEAYLKKFESQSNNPALEFRNENGGNILFRPIGIQVYFQVISTFYQYDGNLTEIIEKISMVDRTLNNDLWSDVIWDNRARKILYSKENKDLARYLMLYILNFDLSRIRYSDSKLKNLYASVVKRDVENIYLPSKINL